MDPKSNFLSVSEKFLQSDASIIQLSDSFTELVKEFKSEFTLLNNENKAVDATAFIDCINQYLHCIIEYAEGGTAQTRSSTLQQLCNKICTAVEELKIKHVFIKNLSLVIFEFLLGQPSWIAKEILRMYNVPIQSTEKSLRSEVVQDKGPYYLGRLMDALPFGDFDFQIIIIETLFRICTKEILNNMAEVNLPKEQAEAFCKINTDEFDLTARKFLNVLNEQEKHVVSLLCNKVTFDDYQLQEPPELASFKGMWVDFNVKARTVSLFLNNESFNQDCKWEMITLFPENILKTETSYVFNEEHGKKEGIAKFILKRQCQLCYAVTQHELLNCRLLVLHSLDTEKFREIFNRVFPKIHKVKPKQAGILNYKRVYKPLDIVSVKSSTTNVSTTFNVTLDSSFVGKKRKSSVGRHSVDLADSTIKSISSRSRSASSKKSMNSSIHNQSIPSEIIKNWEDDLSLSSFKLKKRNENDEISSSSNLSVLELVKTKRDSEKAVATKKFKISSLDHVESKDASLFKYSNEFLSNLIEIDDDEGALGGYEDNYSRTKSKLTKKEADSTTLISGLYNSKLSLQDDELIASDVLHSVEDLSKKEKKKKPKILDNKNVKKQSKIKSTLMKFKQDKTISRVTSSSLSLSSLSADNSMDGKINIEKEKKLKLHKKLKNSKKKVIEEENKIVENTDKLHCLGVKLSPDLFYSPIEEPTKDENEDPNKVDATKIVQGFKSEARKKHSKNVSFLWALPNLSHIEPVRDCNLDKFDELKLERPKEAPIEKPICDNLPEPDLIKVSQPKYKDICTESDIFETAKTNLDSEEVPKSILTANNLTLFQDLSQDNYYVQSGSEDNFQEDKLTEEYKTKIKVLSDIRIQSPIFKSQLSQKDRRQLQEIEISVGVPTPQPSNISADPKNALKNSDEKIQGSLSGSKAPTRTEKIHESNPTSSDVRPLEYQEVEAPGLTYDESNYCKPSSEEVQYSETQRTDSSPEYEKKTSTNDQINSQKTSQDEQSHDISKKNQKVEEKNINHQEKTKICEKTTEKETNYCTLSSQEIEYSETQKIESNPESEEKTSPDDKMNSQKTSQDVSHGISSKTQSIIEENKNQEETKTSEILSSNTHETNSEIIQASTNSGENDDIICNTQQEYKKDEVIKESKMKVTSGEDIKKDNIEEVISDSSKSNYTDSCKEVKVLKKKRKRKLLNLPPVHQKSSKVRKLKETKNNDTITVIEYTQRKTHLSSIMEKTESNISIPEIQKSSVINEEDISLHELKQSLEVEVGKLKEAEKDQTQIQTAKGEKKYLSSMVEENECNISLLEKKKSLDDYERENINEIVELQQSQEKEINNEIQKPHVDNEFETKTFETSQNNTKGKNEIPQDKYEINQTLPNQENIYSVDEQAENKIKTKKSTKNTLEKELLSKTTKTNESCISPPALIQSSEGERGKNEDELALSELRQLLRNKIIEENKNLKLHDETVKQISQPSQESISLGQQEQTKNEISKLKLKQNKQKVRNKHIPTIIASKKISKESIHTSEISKGKSEDEMPLSELRKFSSNKIVEENKNWLSKEENISQHNVKEKSSNIGDKYSSKINDRKKTKKTLNEFIQSPEILIDENEEEIPLAELRHKNSPELIQQISQSLPNNELKSAEFLTKENKEIKENNHSLEVSHRFEDNRRNQDIENKINAFIQEKKYSQNCRVSYYENDENSQNEIGKKNKNVFIHSMIKLDGKVEKPSRESSIVNMGDGETKLQHENTEYQNLRIEKDSEKHVRNLNVDVDQDLRNEHVQIPNSPQPQMTKNQTNNEISNFEVPEDEVEKSMCLLFGMAPDEPVTTKTQTTFQKILGERNKNVNVTENTTNSFISSNVGMLKRGRKLFDKENEEENFMDFTMAQDKIETTQIIRKPGISKSLIRESEKTQPKTSINKIVKKGKEYTTIKRYSKEHKPLEQHSRYHGKKLRTNKLDAFYDRVIEKLKTPTSSKTSYQAVPKVSRNENDHLSKYDLDFSLVKESYQKKTEKPILKRKVSLQEVAHKKAKSIEERNPLTGFQDRDEIIESPTEEEDEDMRELIRAIGTIIQKFAKGHLKTPSPSVQKLLLASAETLLQL